MISPSVVLRGDRAPRPISPLRVPAAVLAASSERTIHRVLLRACQYVLYCSAWMVCSRRSGGGVMRRGFCWTIRGARGRLWWPESGAVSSGRLDARSVVGCAGRREKIPQRPVFCGIRVIQGHAKPWAGWGDCCLRDSEREEQLRRLHRPLTLWRDVGRDRPGRRCPRISTVWLRVARQEWRYRDLSCVQEARDQYRSTLEIERSACHLPDNDDSLVFRFRWTDDALGKELVSRVTC